MINLKLCNIRCGHVRRCGKKPVLFRLYLPCAVHVLASGMHNRVEINTLRASKLCMSNSKMFITMIEQELYPLLQVVMLRQEGMESAVQSHLLDRNLITNTED